MLAISKLAPLTLSKKLSIATDYKYHYQRVNAPPSIQMFLKAAFSAPPLVYKTRFGRDRL